MQYFEDDTRVFLPLGFGSRAHRLQLFTSPFDGLLRDRESDSDMMDPHEAWLSDRRGSGVKHLDPSELDSFVEDGSVDMGTGGAYESSTVVYTSKSNGEGPPTVEKSTTYKRRGEGCTETCQSYSNSLTRVDKCAVERHLGEKHRRVTDRDLASGEEKTQNLFHGVEDANKADFHDRWKARAGAMADRRLPFWKIDHDEKLPVPAFLEGRNEGNDVGLAANSKM